MRTQRNKKSRSALIAAATAVMTAMSTSGNLLASSPPQGCYLEEFPRVIQSSQSLDILFVTDTSRSLENKKARIAAGIDSFVGSLSPSADYQIAVMPAHGSLGLASGRLWKFRNNPYVLSSKTMSLSQIQKALYLNLVEAPMDYWADGGEEGLYSLYHSMDAGKLAAIRAKGFFRPNAALAVVFISDENDICAVYPAGVKRVPDPEGLEELAFKRDCAGITPSSVYQRLIQLQNGRPLIVSGVVYNDLGTVIHNGGQDEYGYGYMDLIKLAGGLSVDIAKGDFSEGLGQVGEFSAKQMQSTVDFKLAHSPVDPNSILVTLRNSSAHSDDDDNDDHDRDHDHGQGGGSCHCKYENGFNGSSRHCEADDKDKFDSRWGSHSQWHSKSISSSNSDGRVVDFNFDDRTNIVHILDETAPEPLAEIQYCLKSVSPSPSPTVVPSPSPTVVPTPSPTVTVTPTPVPSPSVTITPTPSPSATVDPSPSPTVTVTPTPDPSPTVVPTPSPTVSVTPTPDPSPTVIPSPSPTVAPSPSPTMTVTPTPDPSPTVVPSPTPSVTVTPTPSPTVTVTPTPDPSPTVVPTPSPTVSVTPTPDPSPTVTVTPSPSPTVTVTPSPSPTVDPSPSPSPTGCTGPFCGPGAGT